jgi:hypothetical protein
MQFTDERCTARVLKQEHRLVQGMPWRPQSGVAQPMPPMQTQIERSIPYQKASAGSSMHSMNCPKGPASPMPPRRRQALSINNPRTQSKASSSSAAARPPPSPHLSEEAAEVPRSRSQKSASTPPSAKQPLAIHPSPGSHSQKAEMSSVATDPPTLTPSPTTKGEKVQKAAKPAEGPAADKSEAGSLAPVTTQAYPANTARTVGTAQAENASAPSSKENAPAHC